MTNQERAALAQQAEPTGKESLQVESVVAENATTQQQIEQTPPSEYRRGYWAGFAIGKREGRIEAEDELAQQAEPVEPVAWRVRGYNQFKTGEPRPWRYVDGTGKPAINTPDCCDFEPLYTTPPQQAEPVQEPVAIADGTFNHDCPIGTLLYTTPPPRKPLTQEEIPAMAEKAWKPSVYYDAAALLGTDGLVALVRAVEQAHGIKE